MVGLKDVAKLANVSVMTVSRVINGNVNVADQTKNRVESAIRELGYVPNRIAKALVNSCTKTIGVLFSNIFNPVYMSILSSIEKRARELGYQIVICNASDYNSAVTDIKLLMSKMIDGIIILPVEFDAMNDSCTEKEGVDDMWKFYEKLRSMIAQYNFPCVVIDIDIGIESVDYVCHDYAEAARIGIEYLIGEGFKRIHFVNSELNDGLWAERQQIYRQVMKDRGLEHEIRIDYCENKSSSAFKLAKKIMTTGERPEAFYCANDVLAIGVMQAISDCGLRIPKDISVMGNDGIYIGDMVIPPLTTVDICSSEIGKKSVDCCCDLIAGNRAGQKIYIQPQLRRRKSVLEVTQRKEITKA